ncbi:hypothetical protein BS78_05G188100 [Paspalum vaginatum]|nr:hypothetical protein BS78_05G188100 [Paspalum vaginatum]
MKSLVKLFYDWEIQLQVLLSFAIQVFLFFTGGLRRRSTNALVRLSIWLAYLGADTIAVYCLGSLSRHVDAHPLASFWAPFLLVHLGCSDTVTAFSMEDNSLWLRHLLNLVMQTLLATYVFWKSIGRHNVELLVSGMFVFIVGIIRYGERIWSLKCGHFEIFKDSSKSQYDYWCPPIEASYERWRDETFKDGNDPPVPEEITDYHNTVWLGLGSVAVIFPVLVYRESDAFRRIPKKRSQFRQVYQYPLKVLEISLGIIYDDLYTKAPALRRRNGIILRCISHICALVAFVVFFLACDRGGSYDIVDIAITYTLFIGVLFLDICGFVSLIASARTWAWLKAGDHDMLARFSWSLFSSDIIGWSKKKPLWSNAMGQYNLYGWWVSTDEQHKPRSLIMSSHRQQCMMIVVWKLATLLGVGKKKIFSMSKLLGREHVSVDGVLKCVLHGFGRLSGSPKELPNLHLLLFRPGREGFLVSGLGFAIVNVHALTEALLSKYYMIPQSDVEATSSSETTAAHQHTNNSALVEECQKLSRYMMYLMVAFPSLLPLDQSSTAVLEEWQLQNDPEAVEMEFQDLQPSEEILEEIREVWIRLIIYAAYRAQPETHVAQLARGGELLTFVWLQLSLYCFDSSISTTLELVSNKPYDIDDQTTYAMYLPP